MISRSPAAVIFDNKNNNNTRNIVQHFSIPTYIYGGISTRSENSNSNIIYYNPSTNRTAAQCFITRM